MYRLFVEKLSEVTTATIVCKTPDTSALFVRVTRSLTFPDFSM